jgi:hypothetical protein
VNEILLAARIPNMEQSTLRRALWAALVFLTLIGCAIVIRRVVALTPTPRRLPGARIAVVAGSPDNRDFYRSKKRSRILNDAASLLPRHLTCS